MHGAMPRPLRVQVHDEELGKKDDGRKSTTLPLTTPRWNSALPRFRKRRWLALVLALAFAYVFIANIPTDLGPVAMRVDRRVPGRTVNGTPLKNSNAPVRPPRNRPAGFPPNRGPPAGRPPVPEPEVPPPPPKRPSKADIHAQPEGEDVGPQHYFDGEITFPLLDNSLTAQSYMYQYGSPSSVLFTASNLESAALLIPMVCEMAKVARSVVNFAYFGRDDLAMSEIQDINGAQGGCNAAWHDARPTYSVYSSDDRFGKAIELAISTMVIYFRPEVFFHADPKWEEPQLIDSVKISADRIRKPIVNIPSDGTDRLMWMTRLDAESLTAWHHLDINIVIQVTKEDIGTLPSLLKSILRADYIGHRHPRVTLEIPASLDAQSQKIIEMFQWPPSNENDDKTSGISVRKHISHHQVTPLESSIRTVEAFYPSQSAYEHVMILSPNVELSRMWYHYLVFNVLEYAYSLRSSSISEAGNLAGISLITPIYHTDQERLLKPPKWSPPKSWDPDLKQPAMQFPENVPFLWQAPDATATLYFGHKWKELHSFLSLRLTSENGPTQRRLPPTMPPFLETLNELMELRGWHVLYPNLPAHHIATYDPKFAVREEFSFSPKSGSTLSSQSPDIADTDPYESAEFTPKTKPSFDAEQVKVLASTPIHNVIQSNGLLPALSLLPVLDSAGEPTSIAELQEDGHGKCALFRIQSGGCPPDISPTMSPLTAEDLFCDEYGRPYSGTIEENPNAQMNGWAAPPQPVQVDTESWKNNALGDAVPIEGADDEGRRAQMQQEFREHIQRQRSGIASDADDQKAAAKSASSTGSAGPEADSPPERAPGW